jgi:y4mF family transcriptional regulator
VDGGQPRLGLLFSYFLIGKLCRKNPKFPVKFPDQEIIMSRQIHSPQDLGRIVRETRKRLKLTQPQLALAANVGVRFIVEMEAGKSTLRLENILRVLQALGGVLSVEGMDSLVGKLNENSPHNPESEKNTDTLIPL